MRYDTLLETGNFAFFVMRTTLQQFSLILKGCKSIAAATSVWLTFYTGGEKIHARVRGCITNIFSEFALGSVVVNNRHAPVLYLKNYGPHCRSTLSAFIKRWTTINSGEIIIVQKAMDVLEDVYFISHGFVSSVIELMGG